MRKIYMTGLLKNGEGFQMTDLVYSDLDRIVQLQKKAVAHLASPQFLQPLLDGEVACILSGRGRMIGTFVQDRLVAFRAFFVPGQNGEDLGGDVGMDSEERSGIIYSEVSIVDPHYRGNHLQSLMGKMLMKEVDSSQFRYVLATVAPFNIASIKDKLSLGMEIAALKKKYHGKWRYIFMKDLTDLSGRRPCRNGIFIKMDAIQKQQQLLESGYRGKALERIDGKWHVRFCDG